ncbi:tetratricopeptide repeat protein [Microbulbifer yueqingensis]|uniref:Tetratricopeptide repeat-containing protein n=1 Tax=Microbulbifer yueqingensis TaxID=658219 RepID=A0A1G8VY21_9GAMM|nr:tetratricopeptide repeat protein [Microbulbifer yueqingensis]SDJ70879.1 Tetratricopeptide repeat-containing protein [Microbulbifer yueqingensis]
MHHRDRDSENHSYIEPADFSFGRESEGSPEGASGAKPNRDTATSTPIRRQQLSAFLVGALLLSGVVAVFWLLPQTVEKPPVKVSPLADHRAATQAPPQVKTSPYTDAEIARQRRKVQEILQEIFVVQEELQERRVEIWAAEDFSAARGQAEEADATYRQRSFKQALDQYEQALASMRAIRESVPQRIEQHLAEGKEALDKGDAEAAHTAFDLVLTISEGHPRGTRGKERAEKLPEVWEYFTRGRDAFAAGNLGIARESLEQALAIDAETAPAQELLPQILSAITERDYSEAMSAGYAAIAAGDFARAQAQFERARKLKPSSQDPAVGLQQAANGLEQTRVDSLFAQARRQEESERWHQAVKSYQQLLDSDSSLVQAISGKARATARARLDDQLQELLDDPLSLGSNKRNRYAREVLEDARQVGAEGPRLTSQIDQLETALTQALVPVPVRFRSDSSTRVSIYRVGTLGNFSERQITLKPGRYTAVGRREGYRDVRREFTVLPGAEPPTVVIQCAEKINGANNG